MKRRRRPAEAVMKKLLHEYGRVPDVLTASEFTVLYKVLTERDTQVNIQGHITTVENKELEISYSIARSQKDTTVEVRRVVKGVTFVDNITAFWDHNATYNGGMQRVIRTHTAFGPEYSIFISCPNEDNQYEVSKIPIQGAEIQLFDILETTFPQLLFVRDPKKVAEEFRKILYSKLKERF